MKKVAITGANGTIGTMLRRGLTDYEITPIDLPEIDVTNYKNLLRVFPGHAAVVHLAWDGRENFRSDIIVQENKTMLEKVYQAAFETGVPKVIMASSIHAADVDWNREPYLSTAEGEREIMPSLIISTDQVSPDKPYGATKAYMEALGRQWAKRGLFVVCIRFGGVNPEDAKIKQGEPRYARDWLSHRDCVTLIKHIIEIDQNKLEDNYHQLYGISNNSGRIYSMENKLGWTPKDNSANR